MAVASVDAMATVVLTAIGDDRSGLVDELAAVIADHGGNWASSSMSRLASKFAGIVEVDVPAERCDALIEALAEMDRNGALDISAERAEAGEHTTASTVELHLVGQDRPGIVREVAHALAGAGVGIDELTTWTMSAPMSGEMLFEANAVLSAPPGLDHAELAAALEAVADELMVDIELATDAD